MQVIGWGKYELYYDLRSLREENTALCGAQKDLNHVVTVAVAVGMEVIPACLAGLASAFRLFSLDCKC